ncbi:hypothetical protein CK203_055872 [Vitis vinifera]|uniref:Reverse transcriptase domain-containing protein n=1 Tax=Vitis vinifera TaxID=29760 RepID=A0A438GP72_VITVI|nr:hypothetical protein CK203_055872 [Vitis vinifera]
MSEGVVRSLGSGRFLDWRALDASGTAGENGTVWVFMGVYGPFTKEERECLWEEIGAIRGLWEDPWVDGYSSARGSVYLEWGPNNQSWLDWIETKSLEQGVFRNLGCNKAAALQQVEFWDLVESDRILSVEETELKRRPRKTIKMGAFGRNSLETIIKGDLAKGRGQKYELFPLEEGIANAYQQMLSEGSGWQADIGRLRLDQISHQEAKNLEAPFSEAEILDASLIANEAIDSWQKRKEKGVICKLDIEKAYDSMNWASSRRSLSPYLFVIGMEVLGVLIRRAVEGGFLSGDHLSHLSWILFWFEAASGLKINLGKSEIIPVGEVEDIEELAVEIGCRVGSLPSQYLGLPLGAPNKALRCGMEWKKE